MILSTFTLFAYALSAYAPTECNNAPFTYAPIQLCTYLLMHLSDYAPVRLCNCLLMHLFTHAPIR